MAVEEIELDLSNDELPDEIQAIVDESDSRIDELFASGGNVEVPRYMPSDPELFFRVLEAMTERDLPLGRVFCEWGCGFGVCACIAAKLGYETYGIELDPKMAKKARRLADDLGIPIEVVETSYVPDGYDSHSGMGGEVLIKEDEMHSRDDHVVSELIYDGMDREIAEIDVFFVYPWPLEQDFMRELFDEIAAEGAILIAFHKSGEILTCRKIHDDDDEEE
jgi:Methyltransferase domain